MDYSVCQDRQPAVRAIDEYRAQIDGKLAYKHNFTARACGKPNAGRPRPFPLDPNRITSNAIHFEFAELVASRDWIWQQKLGRSDCHLQKGQDRLHPDYFACNVPAQGQQHGDLDFNTARFEEDYPGTGRSGRPWRMFSVQWQSAHLPPE